MDEKIIIQLPQPVIFFGYLYNVGTVIFGPWIPFKDYLNIQYNNYSVTDTYYLPPHCSSNDVISRFLNGLAV